MSTPSLQDFHSVLSREDLEDLLEDPTYFQAIFHSLQRVQDNDEADLFTENNLALQAQLYKLREETQAGFDDAKSLENRWKELDREQKEVYQRFTPQFLLMRLKHSITAQDDASEEIASSFVQQLPSLPSLDRESGSQSYNGYRGVQEVDQFVKEFKESRKTYHKRALWAEKWNQGQVFWRDN